ncbi:hypothetical protein ACV3T5_07055 [Clostridium perfringens]|nr:hypothetical protein [Clostridium perfringens]
MKSIEVTTKNQLKEAVDKNYDEIVVNGELAKKLNKAKNIKKLSGATIGVLAATLSVGAATAPITGGLSLVAAAPIAALTGADIALIIAVSFVGLALVTSIYKGYDEIEISKNPWKLKLKKKSNC